jgi:hypothetical protein
MANRLRFWGFVGFMLASIGAVVAASNWPESTTRFKTTFGGGLEPSVRQTGSDSAAHFGLVLLGVGSTMLWVVVGALAVYCGLRAKEEHDEIRESVG